MPLTVGVIDCGTGNIGSVVRALGELRTVPRRLENAARASDVDVFILPGVGNFAESARRLRAEGWFDALHERVLTRRTPLFGICLGMQMLATASSEGSRPEAPEDNLGLNLIPGHVEHLARLGCNLRVPHVGWNAVQPQGDHPIMSGIPADTDFYFVHSFAFVADSAAHVAATARHGISLTAAVADGCVAGTQFHPEKSSRAGFRVLQNFLAQCS